MELFIHDISGQPAVVIDIRQDIEIRSLYTGQVIYSVEPHGEIGSSIVGFVDGISSFSFDDRGYHPMVMAIRLADEYLETVLSQSM